MRIARETLLNNLVMVALGLSKSGKGEVIQQSSSFVFKEKRLITFNDEIACSIRYNIGLDGAVKSDPLLAILGKIKEDYVDIQKQGNHLLVRGKGQVFGITMEHKIELPVETLEQPTKWKPLPDKFTEAIELVANCAGRDENQFPLICIHITPKFVEAYDNYQFARFKMKFPMDTDALIRKISLVHIIQRGMIEFSETDHWFHFRNAEKLVLSCRRWMDKYQNLNYFVKESGRKIDLPKSLNEIADRAEIFSAATENHKDNNIRVELREGWVHVKGEGQFGWYKGRRKVKYTGEPIDFMIQPKMLIELVKQHTEVQISQSALKAELGNFMFLTSLAVKEKPELEPTKKKVKK